MRLRSILGITLLAIPVSVSADVGVIDDQNQQHVLFRQITPTDGEKARRDDVFLVKCEGEPVALTREYCKSKDQITVTYTEFSRNVHALYGVSAGYGDKNGIYRITQNLEELSRELSEDDVPENEMNHLKQQKLYLTHLQKKLIRLNQVIFSKLDKENSGSVDTNYGVDLAGGGNAERLKSAFLPVWFDGTSKIWKLAKLGGDYYEQMKICKPPFRVAMTADYQRSLGTASTMRFLAQSAIGSYPRGNEKIADGLVWAADTPEVFDNIPPLYTRGTAIDLTRESTLREWGKSPVEKIFAILCVMDWNEKDRD